MFIREYLADYPDDVAGLVFVDPSTEDRLFTMLNGEGVLIASLTPEQLRTTFPVSRSPFRADRRRPGRRSTSCRSRSTSNGLCSIGD